LYYEAKMLDAYRAVQNYAIHCFIKRMYRL
jgi:hypothetical protein